MKPSDVRIVDARAEFRPVPFAEPLRLSSGPITGLTEARVTVTATTRDGRAATGLGSVLLSYPWAGGDDATMRASVRKLAAALPSLEFGDPFGHGARLLDLAATLPGPLLAAHVALGPVDQAVHDAWATANGSSAYRLYDAEHLDADLGAYLGDDFAGHWPAEWLSTAPAPTLPVQYVLGVGEDRAAVRDRRWLKVKLSGQVTADIERVRSLTAAGVRIALDANEAYREPDALLTLLRSVDADYVEQPVPRGTPVPAGSPIPLLADEGLPDPRDLDSLSGWDGVVVKTCRGQTAALLTYCWARHRNRFVVQQDLTHVGPALAHAAMFAAHCSYTLPAFECNSLHYAPEGNRELAVERPGLVDDQDGTVQVDSAGLGIR